MQPTIDNEQTTTGRPASKITRAFEKAKSEGRGVIIPYFMCGYPSAERSVELIVAAAEGGADIIELGMPFSDPLADGATIQHAGHLALERGMSIKGCMQVARQVSARTDATLLLMGYYNPVRAYGLERFCQEAAASGVSGLIIPDLPPEEAAELQEVAGPAGLALIFLIPPTISESRIARIVEEAARGGDSFIYCVSLSGVTGARTALPENLRSFIARVRHYSEAAHLPLAVGFGLSTPEHVAEVTSFADGAVIGSAIVNLIDRESEETQVAAVRKYLQGLREVRPASTKTSEM